MPLEKALQVIKFLVHAPNVVLYEVDEKTCVEALKIAEEKKVGFSDAVLYVLMLQNNIREVYSFDKDFDKLKGIRRVVT